MHSAIFGFSKAKLFFEAKTMLRNLLFDIRLQDAHEFVKHVFEIFTVLSRIAAGGSRASQNMKSLTMQQRCAKIQQDALNVVFQSP